LAKFKDLLESDDDLKRLADAKTIIPKNILPQIKKRLAQSEKFPNFDKPVKSKEEILSTLEAYEKALGELEYVDEVFTKELSELFTEKESKRIEEEFSRKIEVTSLESEEIQDSVMSESTDLDDVIKLMDNPLDTEILKGKVSDDTIEVVKLLELNKKYRLPQEAIKAVEGELLKLNKESFKSVNSSKVVVATGGSVIKLDLNSKDITASEDGSACQRPTITGENIAVYSGVNMVQCTSILGWNSSGGRSSESISGNGHFSWQYYGKIIYLIGETAIGLSYADTDNNYATLNYGFRTKTIGTGLLAKTIADVFENGNAAGSQSHIISFSDVLKVERLGTAMKYYINDIIVHESVAANPESPLIVDLAFATKKSAINNLCLKNSEETEVTSCSGLTNLGVADYLRLEQEICCYVSGEVSHIENVLQGEYKERSTRKLRRSETTTTFETEETSEKLTDTSTTDRYEMESETSQVVQEDSAFDIGVNVTAKYGTVKMSLDTGFATATSSTSASTQAVSYGKEVTTRALERVVTRVREERVNKIIDEFEENNVHGLDNSNNATGHVVGLYRWVDKIYKNQIVNYGKRLMVEFMIPEPAKFHLWAMAKGDLGVSIEEPVDPRIEEVKDYLNIDYVLDNHTKITSSNYAFWAAAYGVKVDAPPAYYNEVSKGFTFAPNGIVTFDGKDNTFNLPEDYILYSIELDGTYSYPTNRPERWLRLFVADQSFTTPSGYRYISGFQEGILPISMTGSRINVVAFNLTAKLKRTDESYSSWQIDTFNKILTAYKEKKAEYENALAEAKSQASLGIQINGNNPLYNRTIESGELKKSCLEWLNAQMGENHYTTENVCDDATDMPVINFEDDLGCYMQQAKFFEQAFDWEIMSYLFYPYFLGKKCSWKELYRLDDTDPIFRGFLHAGMARVVVPVSKNFEEAVLYYLETGKVWKGGEVPTVDDELYVSIIEELQEQESVPVGEPLETRLPTSLNVLQKDAAGIEGDGLPCFCDEGSSEGTGGSTMEGGSSSSTNKETTVEATKTI